MCEEVQLPSTSQSSDGEQAVVEEDDNNMLGFMRKKSTVHGHGGSVSEVDRYRPMSIHTDDEQVF